MIRALEDGADALARAAPARCVGFAFLTKMLQAFLVLPALRARVPASPAPTTAAAGASGSSLAAGRGACSWRPAGGSRSSSSGRRPRRPYIGGSQNNSILELTFGYNGFGRLTGNETGSVGGAAAGGGARPVGRDRAGPGCSTPSSAARSRGCCPAALILLVAGLWRHAPRRRAPTGPARRCSLWGGWLLVTGLRVQLHAAASSTSTTRSRSRPAIGALVGIGATALWQERHGPAGRISAAAASRSARRWRTCCSTGRRTGCRGCAGSSWSRARPPRAWCWRRPGWGRSPVGPRRLALVTAPLGGPGGRAGRADGVRAGHGGDRAHRRDPDRRPGRSARVRRRPGRRGGPAARAAWAATQAARAGSAAARWHDRNGRHRRDRHDAGRRLRAAGGGRAGPAAAWAATPR